MPKAYYEVHQHSDPTFPIFFHHDVRMAKHNNDVPMHWHENPEFLFFTDHNAYVQINGELHEAAPGDLIVVNSGELHGIFSQDDWVGYHCLITNLSLLEPYHAEHTRFATKIQDVEIAQWCRRIAAEHTGNALYHKEAMLANITGFLICMLRKHTAAISESKEGRARQLDMVKAVIRMMQKQYDKPLNLEDIAQKTGFSKYYISHVFREITGQPPIQYFNRYRCNQAKNLIASGMDVSQAALNCGFENLSYFSRTYRKYFGHLPSADKR